jgi:hypothetical protein
MHFNVDKVQTLLMRIEGNLLFLGTPEHALRKHAYHDDPTFTNPEPNIIRETYYDLTDAKVCKFSENFLNHIFIPSLSKILDIAIVTFMQFLGPVPRNGRARWFF